MMNISQLTTHIKFDDIFERNTIDGKIEWCKIAFDELPIGFIDQYFTKLKAFGIEKTQKLDDMIIRQHANELNWYSLLKYQSLSEEILLENSDRLTKQSLWPLVLKTQKLSFEFMIDNLDRFKTDRRASKALAENGQIDESVKQKILGLLPVEQ